MATKENKEEQIIEQEEKKEKTKKQSIPHEKLNKECNNVPYKEIMFPIGLMVSVAIVRR